MLKYKWRSTRNSGSFVFNNLIISWITYHHNNVDGLKTLDFCISYNNIYHIGRTNMDGSNSSSGNPTAYCYENVRSYTNSSLSCMFTAANRLNGGWFLIIGS